MSENGVSKMTKKKKSVRTDPPEIERVMAEAKEAARALSHEEHEAFRILRREAKSGSRSAAKASAISATVSDQTDGDNDDDGHSAATDRHTDADEVTLSSQSSIVPQTDERPSMKQSKSGGFVTTKNKSVRTNPPEIERVMADAKAAAHALCHEEHEAFRQLRHEAKAGSRSSAKAASSKVAAISERPTEGTSTQRSIQESDTEKHASLNAHDKKGATSGAAVDTSAVLSPDVTKQAASSAPPSASPATDASGAKKVRRTKADDGVRTPNWKALGVGVLTYLVVAGAITGMKQLANAKKK